MGRVTGYSKVETLHGLLIQSTLDCFGLRYMFSLPSGSVSFFVSLLKFNLSFIPIVVLALVFNVTNVIGFTYADRDAKKRWAHNVVSSNWSMGGLGGQMLTGVVKNSVGRVFGS